MMRGRDRVPLKSSDYNTIEREKGGSDTVWSEDPWLRDEATVSPADSGLGGIYNARLALS